MERTETIRLIYKRLATLEKYRQEVINDATRVTIIDIEMSHLRLHLKEVMNDVCPVIKAHKGK